MAHQDTLKPVAERNINELLVELEVPFSPDQIQWRVTNTTFDKKRGQVVPYADPRAYTDRLNALFSPQGWTREYKIETMSNITRSKKGESILTGKVLVTCTVTIIGLGSHSGTGEEWADDDNGMTSADAQAFKRACSCFGLGRYFYDFNGPWVDLDQNRQPLRIPAVPAWAVPESWRNGMRPPGRNGEGKALAPESRKANTNTGYGRSIANAAASPNGNGRKANGNDDASDHELDARILGMESAVGAAIYRSILREHGGANQPKLIRNATAKRRVLQVLESASRGFDRLNEITRRLDPDTFEALLTKLQAPPVREIADMKTLQAVVFGLEELAAPIRRSTQ